MLQEMNKESVSQAVKDPANYKPIIFCTISLLAIGIVMVIFGLIVVLLDSIEMGPPQFDAQYERYDNSSLAHIIGECNHVMGYIRIKWKRTRQVQSYSKTMIEIMTSKQKTKLIKSSQKQSPTKTYDHRTHVYYFRLSNEPWQHLHVDLYNKKLLFAIEK
jgi:hypothetical protein